MENFNKIKTYLKTILDKPTYDKWVKPLTFIKTMNEIIFVGSPDKKKTSWIKKNLSKKINTFTKNELNLTFKLIPFYEDEDDEIISSSINKNTLKYNNMYSSNLQKKYTFDSFAQLDEIELLTHLHIMYLNSLESLIIRFTFTVMLV